MMYTINAPYVVIYDKLNWFQFSPNKTMSLYDHLTRLSADDRRMRFCSTFSDEAIEKYLNDIDITTDAFFVVYDGKKTVGFLHAAKIDDKTYEFGLSVDEEYRCKGIGRDLFETAIQWASNRGVEKVYVNCLSTNRAMTEIAKKVGAKVVTNDFIEKTGTIELPGTVNPIGCYIEYVTNGIRIVDSFLKTHFKG